MKILIAEDESDIAMQYKKVLEYRKHQVVVTHDGEECIKAYLNAFKETETRTDNSYPFDVVVLDHRMPRKTGMEAAKEILAINPRQRIVFVSAYLGETVVDAAKDLNRQLQVMQKPLIISEFVNAIENKKTHVGEGEGKFTVKGHTFKDLDPSNRVHMLLDGLSEVQKPEAWYTIGDMTVG